MKKVLLLFASVLFSFSMFAQAVQVQFSPIDIDDLPLGNGHSKGPENLPVVYIQDYTLTFTVDHPEYVLYIKDENDVVVYTTTVYSTDTQVVLPSTLSGEYKIELVMGNWLFAGYINL